MHILLQQEIRMLAFQLQQIRPNYLYSSWEPIQAMWFGTSLLIV